MSEKEDNPSINNDAVRDFDSSERQIHSSFGESVSERKRFIDRRTPSVIALGREIDWYGNTTLHHAFAKDDVDLRVIEKVLERFPEYASSRNQFNRIPLHYAVDRIKSNTEAVKLLLKFYAAGVSVKDVDGKTPYDLAVKWKHPYKLRKMILDVEPSLDRATHRKMKYGPIASVFSCMDNAVHSGSRKERVYNEEMLDVASSTKSGTKATEEISSRARSFNRLTKSASFSGGSSDHDRVGSNAELRSSNRVGVSDKRNPDDDFDNDSSNGEGASDDSAIADGGGDDRSLGVVDMSGSGAYSSQQQSQNQQENPDRSCMSDDA